MAFLSSGSEASTPLSESYSDTTDGYDVSVLDEYESEPLLPFVVDPLLSINTSTTPTAKYTEHFLFNDDFSTTTKTVETSTARTTVEAAMVEQHVGDYQAHFGHIAVIHDEVTTTTTTIGDTLMASTIASSSAATMPGWTVNPERSPYGYIWLITGCTGALLNALVVVLAIILLRKGGKNRPSHVFILNYTVADLVYCAVTAPTFWCIHSFADFCDTSSASQYKYKFRWLTTPVTTYALVLINGDKLLYIVKPFQYEHLMSSLATITLVVLTWFVGLLFLVLDSYTPWSKADHEYSTAYWALEKSFGLIFPISLSFVLSIWILVLALGKCDRKHYRENQLSRADWRRGTKTVFFIFATTAWTFCSQIPTVIVWCAANDAGKLWWEVKWHEQIYFLFRVLAHLDHAVDPLITIFVNVFYRHELFRLLVALSPNNLRVGGHNTMSSFPILQRGTNGETRF